MLYFCRHVSRCLLINFSLPEIGDERTEEELMAWQELEGTWEASSSCVGCMVSLGSIVERDGFEEIKRIFIPKVQQLSARSFTTCYNGICHPDVVYLQGNTLQCVMHMKGKQADIQLSI